jgi:hypothetical protein
MNNSGISWWDGASVADDLIDVFCPNCGKELTLLMSKKDLGERMPGCGDCAQAGVRPRELYRLLLDPGKGPQEVL